MKAPHINITVVVVVGGGGVGGGLVGHWGYGLNPRSSLSEWMSVIEKKILVLVHVVSHNYWSEHVHLHNVSLL